MDLKDKAIAMKKYARVLQMCVDNGVEDPDNFVTCARAGGYGVVGVGTLPRFDADLNYYNFAIGVVEGKPLFKDDTVWYENLNSIAKVDRLADNGRGVILTFENHPSIFYS